MFKIFGKEEEKKIIAPAPGAPLKKEEIKPLDDSINVYTMPERFRNVAVKAADSKATGLIIVAGGSIFLIVAAIFLYYFLVKNPAQKASETDVIKVADKNTVQSTSTSPVAETPKAPALTPKEAYLQIKQNEVPVPGATSSTPGVGDLGNIVENISGDYAVLQISTKDGTRGGVVNMSVQDGQWKIVSENWITAAPQPAATTTPVTATTTAPNLTSYQPGLDSDHDGLTDKEEAIFGTSATSTDSDGDGYPDLAEVLKLFDPSAIGRKLSDNPNFKTYTNKAFGYDFLYPAKWTVDTLSGDDSLMLKTPENEMMQVISQPNADRASINEWYKKQFSVDSIPANKLVTSATWDAVLSEDGLIAYLTDKKHNYLITIAYNPAQSQTLDYENIFKVILLSFEIKN